MSLCKPIPVKSARKSPGSCSVCHKTIEAGESYQHWQGRYTPRYVAHSSCSVPTWMRETNPLRQEHYRAQDAHSAVVSAIEELREIVEGIVDSLDDRISGWEGTNLENGQQYQSCSDSRDELQTWIDQLPELDELPDLDLGA
jgi:hypothetical protein